MRAHMRRWSYGRKCIPDRSLSSGRRATRLRATGTPCSSIQSRSSPEWNSLVPELRGRTTVGTSSRAGWSSCSRQKPVAPTWSIMRNLTVRACRGFQPPFLRNRFDPSGTRYRSTVRSTGVCTKSNLQTRSLRINERPGRSSLDRSSPKERWEAPGAAPAAFASLNCDLVS